MEQEKIGESKNTRENRKFKFYDSIFNTQNMSEATKEPKKPKLPLKPPPSPENVGEIDNTNVRITEIQLEGPKSRRKKQENKPFPFFPQVKKRKFFEEEKIKKEEERELAKKEHRQQIIKKSKLARKLNKKTRKGQPLMKNQIEYLFKKIKKLSN